MSFGQQCESCAKQPARITEGPFAGDAGMFDYCGYCSKDLCPDCMDKGYCRDAPDHKHAPSGDEEVQR